MQGSADLRALQSEFARLHLDYEIRLRRLEAAHRTAAGWRIPAYRLPVLAIGILLAGVVAFTAGFLAGVWQ
jgi:hypothetical protein